MPYDSFKKRNGMGMNSKVAANASEVTYASASHNDVSPDTAQHASQSWRSPNFGQNVTAGLNTQNISTGLNNWMVPSQDEHTELDFLSPELERKHTYQEETKTQSTHPEGEQDSSHTEVSQRDPFLPISELYNRKSETRISRGFCNRCNYVFLWILSLNHHTHLLSRRQRPDNFFVPIKFFFEFLSWTGFAILTIWPLFMWLGLYQGISDWYQDSNTMDGPFGPLIQVLFLFFRYFEGHSGDELLGEPHQDLAPLYLVLSFTVSFYSFLAFVTIPIVHFVISPLCVLFANISHHLWCLWWCCCGCCPRKRYSHFQNTKRQDSKNSLLPPHGQAISNSTYDSAPISLNIEIVVNLMIVMCSIIGALLLLVLGLGFFVYSIVGTFFVYKDELDSPETPWIPSSQLFVMIFIVAFMLILQTILMQILSSINFKIRKLHYFHKLWYPSEKQSKAIYRAQRGKGCCWMLWRILVFFIPCALIPGVPPEIDWNRFVIYRARQALLRKIPFPRKKKRKRRRRFMRNVRYQDDGTLGHYVVAVRENKRMYLPIELVVPFANNEQQPVEYDSDGYTWTQISDPQDENELELDEKQYIPQLKRRNEYIYNDSDYFWDETIDSEDEDCVHKIAIYRPKPEAYGSDEDCPMTNVEDEQQNTPQKKKIARVIRKRHHLKKWSGGEAEEPTRVRRKKFTANDEDMDEYTWTVTDQENRDIRKLRPVEDRDTEYTLTHDSDETIKLPLNLQRKKRMEEILDFTEGDYTWTESIDENGEPIKKQRPRTNHLDPDEYTIIEDEKGNRIKVPVEVASRYRKGDSAAFDIDEFMKLVRQRLRKLDQDGNDLITGSDINTLSILAGESTSTNQINLEFTAIEHFEGGKAESDEEDKEDFLDLTSSPSDNDEANTESTNESKTV